jgi:hypothetical protein
LPRDAASNARALAARQAAVVDALLDGTPAPPGLDLELARVVVGRKRARTAAARARRARWTWRAAQLRWPRIWPT